MQSLKYPSILFGVLLAGCSCQNDILAYRYNPFQFQFPEHHLEAEVVKIPPQSFSRDQGSSFEFYGLTATLPERWKSLSKSKVEKENKVIYKKNYEAIIISRQKQNMLGCEDPKYSLSNRDFCSAFSSIQDFYWKLYTFSPEYFQKRGVPPTTGELWVIQRKGMFFEPVKKIAVYIGDNSTAFRNDYKPGYRLKSDLLIFNKKLTPDYLIISTTIDDEETIKALMNCH